MEQETKLNTTHDSFKNKLSERFEPYKKRIKKYNHKEIRNEAGKHKWFIFRWEIGVVMVFAFIAAFMAVFPTWMVNKDAVQIDNNGNEVIDPVLGYPLYSNIIYTSIMLGIIIFTTIFIGIFCEISGFMGKYGSSIFVLVPSFVWLLSDRAANNMEVILNTVNSISQYIFWIQVGVTSIFGLMILIKKYIIAINDKWKHISHVEFIYNFVYRAFFVLININILLLLSIELIEYGTMVLHLSDIPNQPGSYNLHSESFTVFLALVTLFFAIMLIIVGLSTSFTNLKKRSLTYVGADHESSKEELEGEVKEEFNTNEVIEELFELKDDSNDVSNKIKGGKNG